jgi:hypothetical protein
MVRLVSSGSVTGGFMVVILEYGNVWIPTRSEFGDVLPTGGFMFDFIIMGSLVDYPASAAPV